MESITAIEKHVGKNVSFGSDVMIESKKLYIGDNTKISDNTKIIADTITIGHGVEIKDNVIFGLEKIEPESEVRIGDYSTIHRNVRASTSIISIGDYGTIHEGVTLYGNKKISIGHNCWIGQWSILNSKAELIIGNNFRMGVQSQIWTHVASGELIEGCNIYKVAPTTIEDDVWLVGHVIVSPGVKISKKSVVLAGAFVNRDTEPSHSYAGVPAKDITDKLTPYRTVSIEEKFNMINEWMREFINSHPELKTRIRIEKNVEDIPDREDYVVFTTNIDELKAQFEKTTLFDLQTKKYTKRRSRTETEVIKYLIGHKARFIPMEE